MPSASLAGKMLLAILRADGVEQPLDRGNEAGRRGHGDAIVDGHQPGGHRAAAGVAGAAQALRIDFRAAGQIVHAAQPIPDAVVGRVDADQERGGTNQRVLGRAVWRKFENLVAFALADGIVDQRGAAIERQQNTNALIGLAGFAIGAVPARNEHARRLVRHWIGQVQVGRDVMMRAAFEYDLLDAIAVTLDRAQRAGIERRALGQFADHLFEILLQRRATRFGGVFRLERFLQCSASIVVLAGYFSKQVGVQYGRPSIRQHLQRGVGLNFLRVAEQCTCQEQR